MGFCAMWVNWMKMCMTSVKYSVIVNGNTVGSIAPGRGLRQGDPISPYLFLVCAEGLSLLFSEAERCGKIHGGKAGRGCPKISHLFFADDSLFFFKGSNTKAINVKGILATYESASGQSINFQKSGITFSLNTSMTVKADISHILGVFNPFEGGSYLGLPSLISRNKRQVLGFLKERMWKHINSWSNRFLSKARREILIKSVILALPAYCMSVFELPLCLCDDLEKMMNSF
ncbi:uncharacterized protein LOC119371133 [Jatropha curcas]|uniref:uncharacterized protein LOC119371133 n=1 Tax=Jatropha curcas TaxID=180498 RepID=UPI0018930D76|nr:uncharacterized protein LOC119371133 [Jatropha curcas]